MQAGLPKRSDQRRQSETSDPPTDRRPLRLNEHQRTVLNAYVAPLRAGRLGDAIDVSVSDTGVGIPADARRRSGLANLTGRAVSRGGTMKIGTFSPPRARKTS